jgi:hypothetical protein
MREGMKEMNRRGGRERERKDVLYEVVAEKREVNW